MFMLLLCSDCAACGIHCRDQFNVLLGLVETSSGVNTTVSFLSVEYPKRQSTLYVVVYRLFKQELVIDVDIVSVALRFR